MLFLIDAQLPPSLAEALRSAGCEAVHVVDLGLLAAGDRQIWNEAISCSAVLVTKDRDFSLLRAASNSGPTILWVRVGYTTNLNLIQQIMTVKAEYLHASLESKSITETATAPFAGNPCCSAFNANFGRTDFDIVRGGVNHRF